MATKKRGQVESRKPRKSRKVQELVPPGDEDGSYLKESVTIAPERRVGYAFKKKKDPIAPEQENKSFAVPQNDDGAVVIDASGFYGTYIDLDGIVRNEFDLINRYRDMSLQHECANAIENIANECIVLDEDEPPVSINLDNAKGIPNKIKNIMKNEFEFILDLLDFNNQGYDLFSQWYIDGRTYLHKMIDLDHPKEGLQEIRYVDPRQMRKVREIKRGRDKETGVETIDTIDEYFIYNPRGIHGGTYAMANHGIKINKDTICYVHSGMREAKTRIILSYLHKAIKPLNQLRMYEDASVINKIVRSPARLIFNIDIGNLPKKQAEQYMQKVIANYKTKLNYDAATGEMKDDRHHISMLENYFFPKREGTTGSSVTQLEGSDSFDHFEGVNYFKQQLFRSLNVPISRLDSQTGFNLGRATEISRDELNFTKFGNRLKSKFSYLFDDLLKTQLQLKGVINEDEWEDIRGEIEYKFATDSYFAESKELEVFHSRMNAVKEADPDPVVGRYYSKDWLRKNILKQTDDEIRQIDKEIAEERGKDAEGAIADIKHQAEVDKEGARVDFETNKYLEDNGLLPEPEVDEDGNPIEQGPPQQKPKQPKPLEKKVSEEEKQEKKDREKV